MQSLRPKIAIIGAGSVGSSFAYASMIEGIAREIVMVDRDKDKASGECTDLNHGLSLAHPTKIYPADFSGCAEADIVVITAGAKQKPGQTRTDLVKMNTEIFKDIVPKAVKRAKDAVFVVVTNPVDILTYATLKISGLPPSRVIGSGTVLDTSRFRYLLSEHCGIDPRNVHAYIIGEHGDSELAVWSNAYIGGMKIEKYCPLCRNYDHCERQKELEKIFEDVKNAAYKIIDLKGATYYAIGLALVRISRAILRDENSVLPVSSLINSYYGINDVCLSLPSVVNKQGVEKFLKIELSEQERDKLRHSAGTLKGLISEAGLESL